MALVPSLIIAVFLNGIMSLLIMDLYKNTLNNLIKLQNWSCLLLKVGLEAPEGLFQPALVCNSNRGSQHVIHTARAQTSGNSCHWAEGRHRPPKTKTVPSAGTLGSKWHINVNSPVLAHTD